MDRPFDRVAKELAQTGVQSFREIPGDHFLVLLLEGGEGPWPLKQKTKANGTQLLIKRNNVMSYPSFFKKTGLAILGAAMVLAVNSGTAADIRANGGTTFNLLPTADPGVFTHTVDGLAQVSLVGNCAFHADVLARFPAVAGQPVALSGTFTFTSADGTSVLQASVEGAVNYDPANPAFVNFGYRAVFTGGPSSTAPASSRLRPPVLRLGQ